ncbi:MAG: flagellar hook-associated protein FlgK [Lachnospiraceae bacterium]|nr:flagellar hook-associated protein FlgK [Lachnospiraceae bacterium]
MASTFLGLTIASSGLTAANAGINVTANNISNRNTVGYSRQVVTQQAAKPVRVYARYGTMGAGVTVTGIDQIRDSYYDHKYWTNQGNLGENIQKHYYMGQIEELYFSEMKASGFTTYYSKFTASLETLYTNPADVSKRNAAIQAAQTLSSYFNDTAHSLNAYQDDTNLQISVMVDRINSAAQNIAALNKQIQTLELNGATANELRDRRANVVDELSQYVGVTVIEKLSDTGSSSYSVKICDQTLVEGQICHTLSVRAREGDQLRHDEDNEGLYDLTWSNGMNFVTYNESLTGMLKGYIDIRDGNNQELTHYPIKDAVGLEYKGIPYYKVQTNLFAKEYTREFNKIQMQGEDFNEESTERVPFFSVSTMTTEQVKEQSDKIYQLYQNTDQDATAVIKNADGSETTWTKEDAAKWIQERACEYAKEQHPTLLENDLFNNDGNGNLTLKDEYMKEYLYGADYKQKAVKYAMKNNPTADKSSFYNPDGTVKDNVVTDYINAAKNNKDMAGCMIMIDYITDQMTAENMCVNEDLILDNDKMATTSYIYDGVDSQDLIGEMVKLADKRFMINGNAEEFMEGLVAVSAIDSDAARAMETNYENISATIENQRLSISGVDEDEEAANLVKYQHAYNLAAKCISVMSEIYNKLINETAV